MDRRFGRPRALGIGALAVLIAASSGPLLSSANASATAPAPVAFVTAPTPNPGTTKLKGCKVRRPHDGPLMEIAASDFAADFHVSKRIALAWMRTQARATGLLDAISAAGSQTDPASIAGSLHEVWFDNEHRQLHLAMSTHAFDATLRRCGMLKGIHGRSIVVDITTFTPAQMDAAVAQLNAALPDLSSAKLFDAFRIAGTDLVEVSVYQNATDEQLAQIQAAAAALPVPSKVERVDGVWSEPVAVAG